MATKKTKCGIYKITGPKGRLYVGQTKDLWSRRNDHVEALYMREHTNPHLQKAWDLHGPRSFSFELVEEIYWCDETLDAREAFWGERFGALTNGYNTQSFNAPPDVGGQTYTQNHSVQLTQILAVI
ncbi:GIY-YIG nuclease family protein [Planktotalea sp.]|uniref:GIY-YIG nuclease family protein n=1 Tax=Planktotalea sp. TaxID=2029877 RepID=UPI003297A2E5